METLKMKIQEKRQPLPARIVLYGPHGIGKTTFGASAPKPVFLPVEDGLASLDVAAYPKPESLLDVSEALENFGNQKEYKTIVIDTLDALENIIHSEICRENRTDSIIDNNKNSPLSFGRGYSLANKRWLEIIRSLDEIRSRGKLVILLAHAKIERFTPPDVEAYDRYSLKIHRQAADYIADWCDCLLFANYKVFTREFKGEFGSSIRQGTGTGERIVYTEERPSFIAKNRYQMPFEIGLSFNDVKTAIMANSKKSKKAEVKDQPEAELKEAA